MTNLKKTIQNSSHLIRVDYKGARINAKKYDSLWRLFLFCRL